jgi:hypothetical protein
MSSEYDRGRVAGYEEAAKDGATLVRRLNRYEAALREIEEGFLPDGTYAGRPIYEIASDADGRDTDSQAQRPGGENG